MNTLGLLPMVGSGSRLGMPFPKTLAPTFTKQGIQPLFWHAQQRLLQITDDIIGAYWYKDELDTILYRRGLLPYRRVDEKRGTAAGTIQWVAADILSYGEHTDIAVVLPDSIWYPANALIKIKGVHELEDNDITLAVMYNQPSDVLDAVVQNGENMIVTSHTVTPEQKVNGWFAFIAKTEFLASWDADKSWAENISSSKHIGAWWFSGHYYDLGTPERYEEYIGVDKKTT